MSNKNYKSINEVSELLKLKKHVIRYWDSRFEGISTRLGNRTRRFFSESNIKKLKDLKDTLYSNGKSYNSFDLAKKIITKKKSEENFTHKNKDNISKKSQSIKELKDISSNLKKILDSLNI